MDLHVRQHRQVRPLHRRMQIRHRRARAHAPALGQLIDAHAILLTVVEVLVARQPRLYPRVHPCARDQVPRALLAHRQRTTRAMPSRGAALIVLGLHEVRQQLIPRPSAHAPLVVVARVAADVDHRVDRRAPAQHPPARQRYPPVAALRLRRRVVVPVDLRPRQLQIPQRHMDVLVRHPAVPPPAAAPSRRVLAQPAREHTSRRSRTHDHIVIHRMSPLPSLVPLRARPQPAPLLLLVRTCTNVPSLGSPVHDQPAFEPRRSGGCRYSGAARSRRPVPRAARARCAQSLRGSGQRRNSGRRPAGRRHTRAVERWRRLAGPRGRSRRRTRLGDAPARLLPSARLHLLLRARRRQRRRVRRSGRHRPARWRTAGKRPTI